MRAQTLALRAINQYRRRDTLAYVGLRYFLNNRCARRDRWANEIATHLVRTRSNAPYFGSQHFKEVDDEGEVLHRRIDIPSPTEMYAEAALINRCAAEPPFQARSCVYSYRLPQNGSEDGIFEPYFNGFRERHRSIAAASHADDVDFLLYTDIKKFYPSIKIDRAQEVWKKRSELAGLEPGWIELGERIIHDHGLISERAGTQGILTGPAFSHFVANLVMDEIDQKMESEFPGHYWRYVDDVVIAGTKGRTADGRHRLSELLGELELELHTGDKDFRVSASTWLEGENDFSSSDSGLWMELVSNIKKLLLYKPGLKAELHRAFSDNGIRLPLLDYESAVAESSFVERTYDWARRYSWARRRIQEISVASLVRQALLARSNYTEALDSHLEHVPASGFGRKRAIPKLRYFAGRLIYLLPDDQLLAMAGKLDEHPELFLISRVSRAIATRDVTEVLNLGTNAVNAAAQVLRTGRYQISCNAERLGEVQSQGAAMLVINGLRLDGIDGHRAPINDFAEWKPGSDLMSSEEPFVQELACLHGAYPDSRHTEMLDTAFDRDEQLAFDVITQLQESSYF